MIPVLNIAHRGASGHAPENTLAAFQKALEMGAHMIELDLHLSKDGKLVVMHDRFLKRTTGRRGSVGGLPLQVLKSLDAGSWFDSRYKGQQIPTLQEVLDLVGRRVRLNLEIKKGLRAYAGLEKILLACIEENGYRGQALISCFDVSILQKVRKLDRNIPIGYLFEKGQPAQAVRMALQLGAFSVHGPARAVSGELIQRAHGEGLKVYVYTVNEPDEMRRWIGRGVDGIFTNYPDRLASLLGATQEQR